MYAADQAFVSRVQQGHARCFVNAAAFRFDDAVFDLVAHAQAVATANFVGFEEHVDRVSKRLSVQCHRHAFFEANRHLFGFDCTIVAPERHAHDGVHNANATAEFFKVFGLVGGAQHVAIGAVGFFDRHFVVEAVGNQKFAHFLATAQLVNEQLVEPRFVYF